eukprot:549342_1
MILKSSDFMLFCDFLDMIPDINQEIESRIQVKDIKSYDAWLTERTYYLGLFVKMYKSIQDIRWAKYLLKFDDVNVNAVIKEVSKDIRTEEVRGPYEITPFQIAVYNGDIDLVKLMLYKQNDSVLSRNVQKNIPKWCKLKKKPDDDDDEEKYSSSGSITTDEPTKIIDFAQTKEMKELLASFDEKNYKMQEEKYDETQEKEEKQEEITNPPPKIMYEKMLIDAFYENNPALFDILVENWNSNNPQNTINVFKFHENDN